MDDPESVLKGALENHYKMIKEFRGWSEVSLWGRGLAVTDGTQPMDSPSSPFSLAILLASSPGLACPLSSAAQNRPASAFAFHTNCHRLMIVMNIIKTVQLSKPISGTDHGVL